MVAEAAETEEVAEGDGVVEEGAVEVEAVIKVSVALHLTVPAGPQCAASGATVRLQTSPMETRMLANAHHQETVHPGRQHALSLDIAELVEVEVAEEEEEEVAEEEEVEDELEGEDELEVEEEEVAGTLIQMGALEVGVSVGETLTVQLTPLTAPSLVTADLRPGMPMEAPGPRLTLMQANAMSRLTAPSGPRTAQSLVFVKKLLNLVQLDLVNNFVLCLNKFIWVERLTI